MFLFSKMVGKKSSENLTIYIIKIIHFPPFLSASLFILFSILPFPPFPKIDKEKAPFLCCLVTSYNFTKAFG